MASALHPYMSNLKLDSTTQISEPAWIASLVPPRPELRGGGSARVHDIDDRADLDLEDAVRELYYMTLASLRGYREILELTSEPTFRNFVEILVQQRRAQCRALAQMSHSLYREVTNLETVELPWNDAVVSGVHRSWVRAVWSFEQEEFGRFGDSIELAESSLEDALLKAANTFSNAGIAAMCRQFALNVCGARQRLEELNDRFTH